MNKKPRVLFTTADKNNMKYYDMFLASLRKFHSEEELPVILYTEEQIKTQMDWYRAKPMFARELIKEYELVIGCDCDQLCLGNLNHILYDWTTYDVGTVLNINRVDPTMYGYIGLPGIPATEYYNNGLVAMRSEAFVNKWWDLCTSKNFVQMPMGEQGFLNILTHFGDYNVICFDRYDAAHNTSNWNGLIAKGEGLRMKVEGEDIVLYPDEHNYPDKKTNIKLYHWAGGNTPNKMNYRLDFSEEVIERINFLVGKDGNKTA